jgi:hypothetical protein
MNARDRVEALALRVGERLVVRLCRLLPDHDRELRRQEWIAEQWSILDDTTRPWPLRILALFLLPLSLAWSVRRGDWPTRQAPTHQAPTHQAPTHPYRSNHGRIGGRPANEPVADAVASAGAVVIGVSVVGVATTHVIGMVGGVISATGTGIALQALLFGFSWMWRSPRRR